MKNKEKTIYLATDHAGYYLKERCKFFLEQKGYKVKDMGAFEYQKEDDYPDFISKAANSVSKNPEKSLAIIFGGSGQGEAIVANRFKNVRACVYYGYQKEIISLARQHNNANVLSIGAFFVKEKEMLELVSDFLDTDFSEKRRHKRRILKIEKYPENFWEKVWKKFFPKKKSA